MFGRKCARGIRPIIGHYLTQAHKVKHSLCNRCSSLVTVQSHFGETPLAKRSSRQKFEPTPQVAKELLKRLIKDPKYLGESPLGKLPWVDSEIKSGMLVDKPEVRGLIVARRIRDLIIGRYEGADEDTPDAVAWAAIYGRYVKGLTWKRTRDRLHIPQRTGNRHIELGLVLLAEELLILWEESMAQ